MWSMSHLSWLPSALLSRWEETLPCSVPASYSEFVSGDRCTGTYISITTIPPRYLPLLTNDWTQGRAWRCGRSCNTHPYLHLPFLMQSQLCLSLCILLPVCVCVCVCVYAGLCRHACETAEQNVCERSVRLRMCRVVARQRAQFAWQQ